ncbi:hypothetical protein NVP1091O_34 [Vibrio phage 1.091.O._10N.286.52.B12]|nr:hypothetical protein NVP1091O_34 [Vibrio phage 1.091.O._10N.286.52.B12]
MSCHVFNIEDANKYGVDAAIILHNLKFWLDHNKANGTHINDGYVWSYNSARAFSDLFPYWSSNKIQKTLKKLENEGVIIVGNYNKMNYDKTKWYTLPEYSLQPNGSMVSANPLNGSSQKAQPIPDVNTDVISNERNTDISKADEHVFLEDIKHEYQLTFCQDAINELELINDKNYTRKSYTGALKVSEWEECESAMRSVDDFDMEYFTWWMEEKSPSMRKTPSLPNMLTDMNGTPFDQFYDSTFMQEWE